MRLVDNPRFRKILSEIQDLNTRFQQNPTFTRLLDYIVCHSYNVDGNSEILVKSDIERIFELIRFLYRVSHETRMYYKVLDLAICLKRIEEELPTSIPIVPERIPNNFGDTPPRVTTYHRYI